MFSQQLEELTNLNDLDAGEIKSEHTPPEDDTITYVLDTETGGPYVLNCAFSN